MNLPHQVCPQCGASLLAGEAYCSNCGRRMDSGDVDQTQYAANSSQEQPVAPPPYPAPPYGSTPQYEYSNYGVPDQAAAPSPPLGSYGAPVPAPGTYPPMGGYPPPSGIPPYVLPTPKKGPNVFLIIGLTVLVVAVVGCGLLVAIGSQVNNSTTQTTSTVTQGTPTAQALFSDNFADNSNDWFTGAQGGYTISLEKGALELKEVTPDRLLYEPFPIQPPDDAIINVNFTLLSGGVNDRMGLILRSNLSNNHHFGYYLSIYADNSYGISRFHQDPNDATKTLTDFPLHRSTTGLKPKGEQNQMSLVLKGSHITLTINGKLITTVNDASNLFPSGRTYFFVATDPQSSGVEGAFNSVSVYPAN